MSPQVSMVILVFAAYFFGAVPFGFLVGRAKGIDIRTAGSGNIGASNVGRLLGKRWFWTVFVLDALKGFVPMVVGAAIVRGMPEGSGKYALWLSAGLAALLGHVFPVYLGFKGGKGVATALGVMMGVYPFYTVAACPALMVFLGVLASSRIISLSSIVGACVFPVILLATGWVLGWDLLGHQWPLLAFAVAVGAMIVLRHRTNITRLRAGTEPRLGRHKPAV